MVGDVAGLVGRAAIGRTAFGMPMPVVFERVEPRRVRWEYHVVEVDVREAPPLDAAKLGALGVDGWLLVSVVPALPRLTYYFVRNAD